MFHFTPSEQDVVFSALGSVLIEETTLFLSAVADEYPDGIVPRPQIVTPAPRKHRFGYSASAHRYICAYCGSSFARGQSPTSAYCSEQ